MSKTSRTARARVPQPQQRARRGVEFRWAPDGCTEIICRGKPEGAGAAAGAVLGGSLLGAEAGAVVPALVWLEAYEKVNVSRRTTALAKTGDADWQAELSLSWKLTDFKRAVTVVASMEPKTSTVTTRIASAVRSRLRLACWAC